ncbi:hypothetical protein TNIN_66721 [Trichonephila inaurata madagascariensis]|uniref:Uncharacterized protein n=1 Tax=Trichonephila inaurata madagascariensis TaxID=2747483 RepID=A0A8X7BVH6_9ARAC|nr:hypothetical protein TNIN_66721 [Trichonephila inaurata madagascariensis]
MSGYADAKGIGREMVPINQRSATIPLNRRDRFMLKEISLLLDKSVTAQGLHIVPTDDLSTLFYHDRRSDAPITK